MRTGGQAVWLWSAQHHFFPESCRLVPTGLPVSQDRIFQPFRLQPPLAVPGSVCFAPGLTVFCLDHPVCRDRTASWASPFTSRLTTTTGRIEFVILRTGRSPSVALHPLSQGRSYFRLQSSNQTLTGTSTPLIRSAHRRTSRHTPCAVTSPCAVTGIRHTECACYGNWRTAHGVCLLLSDTYPHFLRSIAPSANVWSSFHPRQITCQPGSPSWRRPRKPPSFATARQNS